jgi:hypothetical protein
MAETKLEAARRSGSLPNVIGALREDARMEAANAGTPAREQVGLEDAAIRVAAGLTGKSDVERRAVLRDVRPGSTVTSKGVAKTQLSRAEKKAKTLAWANGLSEDQREAFIVSENFDKLSDRQQEMISEVFSEVADKAYSDSIGIADYDFDAETVDVDSLPEDETENVGDSFEVQEGEDVESFDDVFQAVEWEAES